MPDMYLVGLVIILALCFDFINGFHDTANAIATCVATRALSPKIAIMMSAFLNFVGAMISTGVAKTIGGEIVTSPHMVDSVVLIAALASAIFLESIHLAYRDAVLVISCTDRWRHRCSHHLLRHRCDPSCRGVDDRHRPRLLSDRCSWYGLYHHDAPLCFFRNIGKSRVNYISRHIQMASAALMAFSHGSNDAQKSMGIITLALLSGGYIGALEVPWEVKVACATAMCAGTSVGGWRIIRTVGNKIFRMQPVNGLAADLNSSLIIFSATMLHLPVSTTHVVTGSIMGVGWAKRFRAVHWSVAYQMVSAWVMTIPCTAAVGALVYLLLRHTF